MPLDFETFSDFLDDYLGLIVRAQVYSASEAARALGISLDTLRGGIARDGSDDA